MEVTILIKIQKSENSEKICFTKTLSKSESSLGGCMLETDICDGHIDAKNNIQLNLTDSSGKRTVRYRSLAALIQNIRPDVRDLKIILTEDSDAEL